MQKILIASLICDICIIVAQMEYWFGHCATNSFAKFHANFCYQQEMVERLRERKQELKQQLADCQNELEDSKKAHGYVIIYQEFFLIRKFCRKWRYEGVLFFHGALF